VKAVVLVGGEGTRLRPLTETVPKPLLPLVDRAILDHVLDHLVAYGIEEVVMSSPYLEETFAPFIASRAGSPPIVWVTETVPLGTGGAIVSVLDHLGDEPFLALNGDILTDVDLGALVARHGAHGAAATIALHPVEDARAFGLVDTDGGGRVTAFREKPPDAVAGDINAGTYVLEPSALSAWPRDTYLWIEGEVFPKLIADGAVVVGDRSDAYWLDLGTPQQYLRAHADLLAGRVAGRTYQAPWLGPEAAVDVTATVAADVAVGARSTVGHDSTVSASVVMPQAQIASGARVEGSILGGRVVVGKGATVIDSVLGEGARVPDGASLADARVSAGALAEPS
jgi:mannose-1-phosphate guanylyltransferase